MPKSSETAGTATSTVSQHPGQSPWFYPVVALTVLYCGSLIGLAIFTSNPVVLNPAQIDESSLIVSGVLDTSNENGVTIRVNEVLKGRIETETVVVKDPPASQLNEQTDWIFPLIRVSRTEYIVTPLKHSSPADPRKLVYPADPATLNKLKSLLSPDPSAP